jgi:hypothetical protein
MARYFFDLDRDGQFVPDDVGVEFGSFPEVRDEAVKALTEVVSGELLPDNHHAVTIVVRDEDGAIVFRASLRFNAEAPG